MNFTSYRSDERIDVAALEHLSDRRSVDIAVLMTKHVTESSNCGPGYLRMTQCNLSIEKQNVPHGFRNAEKPEIDEIVQIGVFDK